MPKKSFFSYKRMAAVIMLAVFAINIILSGYMVSGVQVVLASGYASDRTAGSNTNDISTEEGTAESQAEESETQAEQIETQAGQAQSEQIETQAGQAASQAETEALVTTGSAVTVKASGLFITEIYYNNSPDNEILTADLDPMEYIELYNSTDKAITFNRSYTLRCASGPAVNGEALTVSSLSGDEVIIPKNGTAVLWINREDLKSEASSGKERPTEEAFRNVHSMEADVPVYIISGMNGFSNTGGKIILENEEGESVSDFYYDEDDITINSSIHLKVPSSGSTMKIYKQNAAPSPGEIEEEQILYVPEAEADTTPPVISCDGIANKIQLGDAFTLRLLSNEKLKSAEITCSEVISGTESEGIITPMVFTEEENNGFIYEGTVKPEELGDYIIRIKARDLSGNETILPAGGSGYTLTVVVKDTGNAPKLTCLEDNITSVEEGEEMNITYSYEDDIGIQKITIYYKTSSAEAYKSIETTSFRIAGKYFAKIPSDELLGQDYVDYYLEAYNLYHSSKTEIKRITINKIDDFTGIRTNLTDGESLAGNVLITAKDKSEKENLSIEIDGTKMKQVSLLEKGAFFTLSFTGNDSYFKNAVSVGNEILTYLAKWSNVMSSKAVFVDQSYFTYREDGSCVVTVTLWAGTQGSAFEIGNDKNNDDYKATGFHLVLTDGTVLNPDNGIDPNTIYKMGDSKGMHEKLDMHFTVPAEKVDALGYIWDTTLEKDGLHEVDIRSAKETKKVQVRVDNTPPQVSTEINMNEKLNNLCTAEFSFTDETGINENTLEVYLNGKILKAPYTFKGASLAEGTNNLTVKIMDLNGNQGIQTTSFTYFNGKLVVTAMTQTGEKKDSIRLKAILGDGAKDAAEITFNEGKRLEVGEEIRVLQGSGDTTGGSIDGNLGTVISDNGEYPYQIYEIQAEGEPTDILQVKLNTEVSYNKAVHIYVYNVAEDAWEILNTNVEDGLQKAEFSLENHVKDNVAQVLVQARGTETTPSIGKPDEGTIKNDYQWDGKSIPKQYDFSFAWITDTQYYTESWPETFTTMNQWIISEIKKQKIKYVIHTGDLVDEFEQTYQWECADKNMKYFEEAGLPYGVLAGNHDVAAGNELYDNYLKYFGENRFKDSPVYGGSYKNNLGHYDLLTIDGEELVIVYMGWDVYTKEVEWMNKILAQYSDRKAIICLHRYINEKGVLDYTGELVQEEVVAKNSNVFAVLNGHYHGAAINITAFDDDYDGVKERTVYQICTDYQSAEKGGSGYVKMLYFDLANDKIYMNSYSPELQDYNYFDADKLSAYKPGVVAVNQDIYELNVDFTRNPRTLTTTFMEGALYTDKIIGSGKSTDGEAEIEWNGLIKDIQYGWYTVMKNSSNLLIRSEVNEFIFLPSEDPEPTIEPEPTKEPEPTEKPEPTKVPEPTKKPSPTKKPGSGKSSAINTPVTVKENPSYNIPKGLTAKYGDTLGDIPLPTGFYFTDSPTASVGEAGVKKFKVIYTPEDLDKFNIVKDIEVSVTVEKAEQKFTAPQKLTYSKIFGAPSFSIKGRVSGDGRITYESGNKKVVRVDSNGTVSVLGCGKAIITLNAAETKNYQSNKQEIAIIIKPQKTILINAGWADSGIFRLSWKKDTKVSGYEICYALNKEFTKNKKTITVNSNKTTTKDFKNLKKGKTYYIKVRAYKTVNGKKIYGNYSTAKKLGINSLSHAAM